MEIAASSHEGIPLLRINGDVDHLGASSFQSAIDRALEAGGRALLVDLSASSFFDSGGLSVLLATTLRQHESAGWLGVVGANPNLLRIFQVVGLDQRAEFRLFSDLSCVGASGG